MPSRILLASRKEDFNRVPVAQRIEHVAGTFPMAENRVMVGAKENHSKPVTLAQGPAVHTTACRTREIEMNEVLKQLLN